MHLVQKQIIPQWHNTLLIVITFLWSALVFWAFSAGNGMITGRDDLVFQSSIYQVANGHIYHRDVFCPLGFLNYLVPAKLYQWGIPIGKAIPLHYWGMSTVLMLSAIFLSRHTRFILIRLCLVLLVGCLAASYLMLGPEGAYFTDYNPQTTSQGGYRRLATAVTILIAYAIVTIPQNLPNKSRIIDGLVIGLFIAYAGGVKATYVIMPILIMAIYFLSHLAKSERSKNLITSFSVATGCLLTMLVLELITGGSYSGYINNMLMASKAGSKTFKIHPSLYHLRNLGPIIAYGLLTLALLLNVESIKKKIALVIFAATGLFAYYAIDVYDSGYKDAWTLYGLLFGFITILAFQLFNKRSGSKSITSIISFSLFIIASTTTLYFSANRLYKDIKTYERYHERVTRKNIKIRSLGEGLPTLINPTKHFARPLKTQALYKKAMVKYRLLPAKQKRKVGRFTWDYFEKEYLHNSDFKKPYFIGLTQYIRSAQSLLKANLPQEQQHSLLVMDFFDTVSLYTGYKPASSIPQFMWSPWYKKQCQYDNKVLFASVTHVLVPKYYMIDHAAKGWKFHMPYLKQHFKIVEQNQYWQLWATEKPLPPLKQTLPWCFDRTRSKT